MIRSTPRFKLSCVAAVATPGLAGIRSKLRKASELLDPSLRELRVRYVGDREMSRLHAQFMDMPWPTDVLTFPIEEDDDSEIIEGEVAVCVPEARRRAKVEGVTLSQELLLYSLHGLLHLCGYNDLTAKEYRRMHAKEDQILTQLGVGPVFSKKGRERR